MKRTALLLALVLASCDDGGPHSLAPYAINDNYASSPTREDLQDKVATLQAKVDRLERTNPRHQTALFRVER